MEGVKCSLEFKNNMKLIDADIYIFRNWKKKDSWFDRIISWIRITNSWFLQRVWITNPNPLGEKYLNHRMRIQNCWIWIPKDLSPAHSRIRNCLTLMSCSTSLAKMTVTKYSIRMSEFMGHILNPHKNKSIFLDDEFAYPITPLFFSSIRLRL